MNEHSNDHAEILRARSRLHNLEGTVHGLGYRVKALEEEAKEARPMIETMRRNAVNARARYSIAELLFAGVVAGCSIATVLVLAFK